MSSNRTVYGRTAYEGFARAIGSQLGLNVVVVDGASACIDARGTIQMPGMNTYQTPEQFAVTCGVVVHEMAHQFYRSHELIDPARGALEHACLNAVLDVADETWVDQYFQISGNARPGELLQRSNAQAVGANWGRYTDWTDAGSHLWKVLCAGILVARLGGCKDRVGGNARRLARYTASRAGRLGVDARAAFRIIRRARLGSKQHPAPTAKRFGKLRRLAAQLAELLKAFAPPAGTGPSPVGGVATAVGEALAAGSATRPDNAREATAQDGEATARGSNQFASGTGGSVTGDAGASLSPFDTRSFELLSPAVGRVAQRIATDGDGCVCVEGLPTGGSLGDAHRLLTDGNCLARWDAGEHAEGVSVSVVLDCSGSMGHILTECAGIARAFARGMRQAAAVQSLVFGSTVADSDDFEAVGTLGGTATHLALQASLKWLTPRSGAKWIVLITDGIPGDQAMADAACRQALDAGTRVLVIGLGCSPTMPGARTVAAEDPARLAIALDGAAQWIETN